MLGRLARRTDASPMSARQAGLSMADYERYWERFGWAGNQYVVPGGNVEELLALEGMENAIVAACIHVRLLVFSEIRFAWQPYLSGRPGALFGTRELEILNRPWPGATTGDLLARMEVDASLYGNSYWVRSGAELVRLDPLRVRIITGEVTDQVSGKPYSRRLVGYALEDRDRREVAFFEPSEVAHYRPIPDETHPFRGRSWLASVRTDVSADSELTAYKHAFLRNAATPNLVVKFDPTVSRESFEAFQREMDRRHTGPHNAYKTLFIGGGADVKAVGSDFQQLALKAVQGAGETRIAAAAGVPASIVGISEGLAGSALNAGNYTAARRRFADGTIRPLWRFACAALETIVTPPNTGVRLWYDDRDVPFLQEDVQDTANIRNKDAATIRTLVDAGFEPSTVVDAVTTGDMTTLVHTGVYSVQLQPPADGEMPADETVPADAV